MSVDTSALPRWIDIGVIPVINILFAMLASALVVLLIGADPLMAVRILVSGAFGDATSIGYTLYYATNFIFTGLAVAVAFHAGLFNIGGEGQAYIGGLGLGLVMLAFDHILPGFILIPLGVIASALFGAAWAFIPAYLQAYRGSHIVITTIMFNFIAAAVMVYLMVNVLKLNLPGNLLPESREFATSTYLPTAQNILAALGFPVPRTPLNIAFVWAIICCFLVWGFLWRTRYGYALRTVGHSAKAALYAGIKPARVTIAAMCLSGALAGFVGVNEIAGVHHRLLLDFVAGYGFTGIAVALMGRNHPFGIVLASLLFGMLFQGGAELAFEIPAFTREMVVTLQGFVILFSGALAYMTKPTVARIYARYSQRRQLTTAEA